MDVRRGETFRINHGDSEETVLRACKIVTEQTATMKGTVEKMLTEHVYEVADLDRLRDMLGHMPYSEAVTIGAPEAILVRGVSGDLYIYILTPDGTGTAEFEPWCDRGGWPRGFGSVDAALWRWGARGKQVWSFTTKGNALPYLPSNAHGSHADGVTIVSGYDAAGWTLHGYVLPRLASGCLYPMDAPVYTQAD